MILLSECSHIHIRAKQNILTIITKSLGLTQTVSLQENNLKKQGMFLLKINQMLTIDKTI